jgi:hypothetical protein
VKFGESHYLEEVYSLFKVFWDNKKQILKPTITSDKVNKLGLSQDSFNTFATRDKNKYTNITHKLVIESNFQQVTPYSDWEMIKFFTKYKDNMDYFTGNKDHRFVLMIRDVNVSKNSNITGFSIGSGKLAKLLLHEIQAEILEPGELIMIDKMSKVPKMVYQDGRMVQHLTETDWYINKFHKLKTLEG